MNKIFKKDVAVDGPVVNEGEQGSSTFSTGQALQVGSLERGQRWTVRRKQEAVFRLLRGEPVELLSRELGVEVYRLARISHTSRPGIYRRSQPVSEKWARNGFQISDNLFARKDGELPENGGPPASHDRTV